MSNIFLQEDIISLLDNRFIVIIGDSIQRAVYKDVVLLLQKNRYLSDSQLRSKGEFTFSGDKLIEGGQYGEMSNGIRYREVRQYQTDFHLVRFYFVTRCYNSYIESILKDLCQDPTPDVILMNSCLWDISRYGSSSVDQYKENLYTLFKRFKEMLPESCLVVWNMTLPISKKARGGFLIPQVEYMNSSLRLDILEANFYVHKLALCHGFNTLDLHYFLRHQLQRRAGDGVHWDMTAHRRITNLILTHVAQAWRQKTPQHARKMLVPDKPDSNINNRNRPVLANKDFTFGRHPNNLNEQQLSRRGIVRNNMSNANNMAHNMANDFANINAVNEYSQFSNAGRIPRPISPLMAPAVHHNMQRVNMTPIPVNNINNFNTINHLYTDFEDPPAQENQVVNIQPGHAQAGHMNFFQADMTPMMNGNQMVAGAQLNWQPYRNEDFRPQWNPYPEQQHHGGRDRNQPYNRKTGRRR